MTRFESNTNQTKSFTKLMNCSVPSRHLRHALSHTHTDTNTNVMQSQTRNQQLGLAMETDKVKDQDWQNSDDIARVTSTQTSEWMATIARQHRGGSFGCVRMKQCKNKLQFLPECLNLRGRVCPRQWTERMSRRKMAEIWEDSCSRWQRGRALEKGSQSAGQWVCAL